MKKYILYIGLLIYCTASAHELSVQQMKEDIEYYLKTIDEKHPDLYRRYTPEQFDSVKQIVLSICQQPMFLEDFNRILLKFNHLTDGHTRVFDTNISISHNKAPSFPYFQIKNDSVWIKNKLLLTVNKFNPTNLIQEMMANQSWENHFKTRELIVNESLPSFLFTFYQITPPYTLSLKDPQTGIITEENIETTYWNWDNCYNFPIECDFFSKESIAVIHYYVCDFSSSERIINIGLEKAFQIMKDEKIKYLFIDVRKNGGGSDEYNEFIFKHLQSKKVDRHYYNKINIKNIDSIITIYKEHHLDLLEKCGNNIFKRIKMKKNIKKSERKIESFAQTGIYEHGKFTTPKNRNGFDGKVFVLQSRQTYSAAIDFCEEIKQRQIGIIVGEEPGQPIDFCGNIENLELPHSKIKFCYSSRLSWSEPPIPTRDGFIVPDIPYNVFDESPDTHHHKLNIEDYKKIIQMSTHLK